jgi:Bacterial capsule synthesis protein PGA_cap
MTKKGFFIVFLVFVVTSLVFSSSYFGYSYLLQEISKTRVFSTKENPQNTEVSSFSSKYEVPKPENLYLNTMFFGDVFWGRRMNKWARASELKTAYPFSALNTLEREKYDAWIADLECPSTDKNLTDNQEEIELKFNCHSDYLPEASKWFDVFSLANNHMDNMEEFNGLNATRKNLENNNIQYFGHFDNAKKEDLCEIVTFRTRTNKQEKPTRKTDLIKSETANLLESNSLSTNYNQETIQYYIPFAMCGFHNVFKLPKDEEMNVISEYSKYFPTIVMPHQGKEYSTIADGLQTSYYRQMVDLGADAILGNHPHSVQNTEAYKKKLIVYSMGNFIFDQQTEPLVTQGIGVNLDFTFEYDQNLDNFQEFAKSCQKFKDDCLQKAKENNLQKPKFKIDYNIVATDNANKLPKKATEQVQQNMTKRTNWTKTMEDLKID